MLRKWVPVMAAIGLLLGTAAAAQANQALKVGVSAGPYAEILDYVAELGKKRGLDIKVVEFNEYTLPNAALAADDLDLNVYQHQQWLDNQVATRGYDIVSIAKAIIVPLAAYSKKIASPSDIEDGATTAIPNDPANGARSLQLLQKAGLIVLKPGVGAKATQADITANPKHLKIKELDAGQLPRALDDVDFAVINLNYAVVAGLDPKKALFIESGDTDWNLVIATRAKNRDNPTIQRFVALYRSPEVKEFILKRFDGTILTTW